MNKTAKNVTACAVFIAIIAVSALITVPWGPIPFTLQTFAISLALYMLNPKLAFASVVIYLLMGALGLPIFSSMRGGIGVIVGPTGGFLWGYALGIFFCGVLDKKVKNVGLRYLCGLLLTAIAYACGTIQYMFVGGVTVEVALMTCVVPFVLIDCIKIACALAIAKATSKHITL